MMRILELGKFYPPHHGGMETLLRSLSEGFVRCGASVECQVAGEGPANVFETVEGVSLRRLASFGTALSTSLAPGYLLGPRFRPADLWHHHFPNPLADAACFLGNRRTPLVITYHSDVIRQSRALFLYLPLLRWLLRRATRIVTTSPAGIEYSPWLQPYRAKCEVIPAGINLAGFAATETVEREAAEIRSSTRGRPIVLTVGRLVGYKGHRYLIESMKGLEAELWMVGTGPLESELRQHAAALGLEDAVRFCGEVSPARLPALFHACEVFALASITPNEAFGLVQVEAMACGKPVVSCALRSGVPFVNLDGRTGLIVPPADAPALNGALRRLLGDAGLRRQLGAEGKARATREFEESVMVSRYWQLIQRLAGAQLAV
jgi:rhamnosyl/mannosyltransferase